MQFTNSVLKTFTEQKINLDPEKRKKYQGQVNTLRDNLAEEIKKNPEYGLYKMLNSGSVAKGTALSTINDMDVAVYVKAKAVEGVDEAGILEYVRSTLVAIYKRYGMKEDQFTIGHHCVKVHFKGSGLDVDVVPVVYEGEADDRGYLITRDTGERVLTSIPLHLKFIRKRKEENPQYRTMVRIIKWWRDQVKKRDENFGFKSFLIEMIWAHIADTEGIEGEIYAALKQFFRYIISTELQEPIIFTDNYNKSAVTLLESVPNIFDPVNPENNVGASMDTRRVNRIIEEAEDALGYLLNAEETATKGQAESCLKAIFGSSFSL